MVWSGTVASPVQRDDRELQYRLAAAEPALAGAGIVKKTVYSSKMRLLFAAGLEGTGHHSLFAAIDHVFTEHPDLVRMNECEMFAPYYMMNGMAGTPLTGNNGIGEARAQMRDLAEREKALPSPGSVAIMQAGHIMHGKRCRGKGEMLSYPNLTGRGKVLQYMDLRQLAEVADAEGVDFRVVYLQRSAKSVILSTTVHRHFQR